MEDAIYRQVTATFVADHKEILELRYVQPDAEYRYLRVTPNHPIMIGGVGWMPARELRFGHKLMLGYFGNVLVGKNKALSETARIYNIQVDEFQTYFVGEYAAWVHNGHDDVVL
jgi:hypothetical protein